MAENFAIFVCRLSGKSGSLYLLSPEGLFRAEQGLLYITF